MTFLVKRILLLVLPLKLDFMQKPEITHMKSMDITEVLQLKYFRFENYLLLKEVYLIYKNFVINSGRTLFYMFFHFPEDTKYRSCRNKAGKKLEGNALANISVYKVYVERS